MICSSCLTAPLFELLKTQYDFTAHNGICRYCEESFLGLDPDKVLKHITTAVRYYYDNILEYMDYDGHDGFYSPIGPEDIIEDMFGDISGEINSTFNGEIEQDLSSIIWINIDFAEENLADKKLATWNYFCDYVKYERRYFFLNSFSKKQKEFGITGGDDPILNPLSLLDGFCTEDFIQPINVQTAFFRAVSKDIESFAPPPPLIESNGTPQNKKPVPAGRMNPEGIPYYYLASDRETAEAEVGEGVHLAEIRNKMKLTVLNFSHVDTLEVPLKLDYEKIACRMAYIFLKEFVNVISEPQDNDRAQLEYIPTQVMVQYLREKHKIDGIAYPSSKNDNGINYCFFTELYDHDDIAPLFEELDFNAHWDVVELRVE